MVIIGRILDRFTAIYPIITTDLQTFWKAKRAGVGPKRHNAARQPCADLAVGDGRLIVSSEHHWLKNSNKNQLRKSDYALKQNPCQQLSSANVSKITRRN
jgi:hypothetical protein